MATKVTGSEVVLKAESYIGKYNKKINKFTKHFAGKYDVSKAGKLPNGLGYCTMFDGYVLDVLGVFNLIPHNDIKWWWHTTKLWTYYKKHHGKGAKCVSFTTDPKKAKPGALAFTGKKSSTHTCIFKKFDGKYVWTIDGNVGGGVKIKKRRPAKFVGFANLNYMDPVEYKVSTKGSNLNVRAKADSSSDKVGSIPNGTVITATRSEGRWRYIPEYGGWVYKDYLRTR